MYSRHFLNLPSRRLRKSCYLLGILSTSAAILSFWPLWIAAWMGVFLTASRMKPARKNESLWVFCLSAPVILPLNAALLKRFFLWGIQQHFFVGCLITTVLFGFLFCLMELMACLISRWLWPCQKQYH